MRDFMEVEKRKEMKKPSKPDADFIYGLLNVAS